jgi:TonB family protein
MRLRSRGFQRFSNYLLLKRLDADGVAEVWRAAPIDGLKLGRPVALHRFPGASPEIWQRTSADFSAAVAPIQGTAIARKQQTGEADGAPFLIHHYEGGRPLSAVTAAAFAEQGTPFPLPVDLALTIADKIALSLITVHAQKAGGSRLVHGALIPQFVWLTEDGEVRVCGQQLAASLLPLLDGPAAADLRPWIAPEIGPSSAPSIAGDIFSAGSILYYLLTGRKIADPTDRSAVDRAIAEARIAAGGEPMPPELRSILERALGAQPQDRYPLPADFRHDLTRVLHGGDYSATTFNLAFYLQTLLRDDLAAEQIEREKEAQINVAQYAREGARTAPRAAALTLLAASAGEPPKSKSAAVTAAVLIVGGLAAAGAAAYFGGWGPFRSDQREPNAPAAASSSPLPQPSLSTAPQTAPVPLQPSPEAVTATDPVERDAAFEEEVSRRVREEMVKLQREFDERQRARQQQPVRPPPLLGRVTPTPAPVSAEQRTAAVGELPQPTPQTTPPLQTAATPTPPATREGQLVQLRDVDQAPAAVRAPSPTYPPLAARQKLEGSVVVTALISETGRVLDARVLRGDTKRVGFDEAALRAVRMWQFTPAMKDGFRVRTWFPVNVSFRLPD